MGAVGFNSTHARERLALFQLRTHVGPRETVSKCIKKKISNSDRYCK
jgi:hypothetical protein